MVVKSTLKMTTRYYVELLCNAPIYPPDYEDRSIFEDKISLIKSKIGLLSCHLGDRRKIHYDILYQLEKDSCYAENLLSDMGTKAYGITRERLQIEKMKFDIRKQKRMEETQYFMDSLMLNKELRETLIEYMEEEQKQKLIGDM